MSTATICPNFVQLVWKFGYRRFFFVALFVQRGCEQAVPWWSLSSLGKGLQMIAQKKRLQPKLEPDDWAEAKSKVGQRQGRRICHLPLSIGSGRRIDPQLGVAIRGPREEEFGARLSDTPYMYSTDLVGNTVTDMSAMHFCKAAEGMANGGIPQSANSLGLKLERGKRNGFARGESEAIEGRAEARRRERSAMQGRRRNIRAVMCFIYGRPAHPPIRHLTCQICTSRMLVEIRQ